MTDWSSGQRQSPDGQRCRAVGSDAPKQLTMEDTCETMTEYRLATVLMWLNHRTANSLNANGAIKYE